MGSIRFFKNSRTHNPDRLWNKYADCFRTQKAMVVVHVSSLHRSRGDLMGDRILFLRMSDEDNGTDPYDPVHITDVL